MKRSPTYSKLFNKVERREVEGIDIFPLPSEVNCLKYDVDYVQDCRLCGQWHWTKRVSIWYSFQKGYIYSYTLATTNNWLGRVGFVRRNRWKVDIRRHTLLYLCLKMTHTWGPFENRRVISHRLNRPFRAKRGETGRTKTDGPPTNLYVTVERRKPGVWLYGFHCHTFLSPRILRLLTHFPDDEIGCSWKGTEKRTLCLVNYT